nr:metalloregulator ArsR/SmtB family transcription factor [Pseudenhygromyxa sp. WMMC2535]
MSQTVDLLSVFADPTRVRLLCVLGEAELSVAELTRITDLPQSRVSTHLRKLKDAKLVRDRRDGSSSFYSVAREDMGKAARELWQLVEGRLDDALLEQDRRRREAALAARETTLRWPDEVAGQMERHYSPGRTWEATARGLLGFMRLGEVLDLGSGDGVNAELLAPRAQNLTCLDISERVIAAARRRLERFANVDFRVGDMHDLPFMAGRFDAVLMLHALTYSRRPALAVAEAARVLRPGGALALVTLAAHDHAKIAAAYDHVNSGFTPAELETMLGAAGLLVEQCEVSSRERRKPYFQVLTAFCRKPST